MKNTEYESEKYGKVTFRNVDYGHGTGFFGMGDKRYKIDGRFSLNVVNSAKYGKEVHFQIYGKEVQEEKRNNSPWNRTEIYFPHDSIKDIIKLLEELK